MSCTNRPPCERGLASPQAMTGGFLRKGSQPFGVTLIRHGGAVPPSPRGRLWAEGTDCHVGALPLLAMTGRGIDKKLKAGIIVNRKRALPVDGVPPKCYMK